MYTILIDVKVTRRIKLHHVVDERDQVMFSSGNLMAAIEWCYEQGATEIRLQGPAAEDMLNYRAQLRPC